MIENLTLPHAASLARDRHDLRTTGLAMVVPRSPSRAWALLARATRRLRALRTERQATAPTAAKAAEKAAAPTATFAAAPPASSARRGCC